LGNLKITWIPIFHFIPNWFLRWIIIGLNPFGIGVKELGGFRLESFGPILTNFGEEGGYKITRD